MFHLEQRDGSSVLDQEGVDEPVVVLRVVVRILVGVSFTLCAGFSFLAAVAAFAVHRRLLVVHLRHGVRPVRVPEVVQLEPHDGPGNLAQQGLEEPAQKLERLKRQRSQ